MNKPGSLFKLKDWLTIPEAAGHLSKIFDEDVTEADVLRLGLDYHLKLSVHFVNHAYAICGKIVHFEDAEWTQISDSLENIVERDPFFFKKKKWRRLRVKHPNSLDWEPIDELPDDLSGKGSEAYKKVKDLPVSFMNSKRLNSEKCLNLGNEITILSGVWDLAMIGAERLDVEYEWQRLTGGPEVTLINLEGVFVEGPDNSMHQLQDSYEQNEFFKGSKAHLESLEKYLVENNIQGKDAEQQLTRYYEDREKFLAKREENRCKGRDTENYFPAGRLPDDSVLVVRTQALMDLQNKVAGKNNEIQKDLNPRAEKTYLNIIGALLECITGPHRDENFPSETKLREFISERYDGLYGVKERTLAEKFAAAKRSINGVE